MRRLSALLLIAAILGCHQWNVWADDKSETTAPSVLERLDRLGDRIFSGVLPGKRKAHSSNEGTQTTGTRAGSAFGTNGGTTELRPRPDPLVQGSTNTDQGPQLAQTTEGNPTLTTQAPTVAMNPAASAPSSRNQSQLAPGSETARSIDSDEFSQDSEDSPLYKRLLEYRASPFASVTANRPAASPPADKNAEVQVTDNPNGSVAPAGQRVAPPPTTRDFANTPRNQSTESPQPRVEPTPSQILVGGPRANVPAPTTNVPAPTTAVSGDSLSGPREPTLAARQPGVPTVPAQTPPGVPLRAQGAATTSSSSFAVSPPLAGGVSSSNSRTDSVIAAGESKEGAPVNPKTTAPGNSANVAWSGRMAEMAASAPEKSLAGPVLLIETSGPREITLGKPSLYEVVVRNIGRGAGNQVRVTIALPIWAEVVEQVSATGTVDVTKDGPTQNVVWMIEQIDPQKEERLRLKLIPRESKPIELAVQYTVLSPVNETKIEVREPKLAIRVEGPAQARFGRAELYRLEIANTGTGEADNVVLSLLPLGTGQKTPAKQNLGSIPAGEKRVVEVELLPRQTGDLQIQMEVTADGGIRSQLEHVVTVVRPALEVAVEGPALQFVNQDDRYHIIVRNPGTAPAENVRIQVTCPESLEPDLTAIKDGKPVGDVLEWVVTSLPPGKETVIEIPCHFVGTGDARLIVQATSEGNLAAQGEYLTQIQAVADLALRVEDPPRPVPVGKDGLYQVIIENRGSKAATDVRVVGFFSEGIEPVAAKGVPHKIVPGQVVFEPISKIEPGEKIVLEIQARAQKPGNHVFRAELRCPTSDIRLATEETTRYYDATLAERPKDAGTNLR